MGILGEEALQNFKTKAGSFTANSETNASFDIQKITQILDGKEAAIIKRVKSVISRPEFAYETSTDINVFRQTVYKWCKILADENLGNMAYPKRYGGGENIADYFAIMETLSYHDLSLVIKFGVQFGLWGMSVQSLGTEKHYAKYLQDIGSLKLPGCFAMTETHHGSNVKGLETTATYNHNDQTFTIHTPNKNAQKEYIGNAAVHGQAATVFAKLVIDGHDYGVNAFVGKRPAAFVIIYLAPGGNTLETYEGVTKALAEMKKTFPKDLDYVVPLESASVVKVSIEEVVHTLVEALILVIIVVFLFLQSWRATLIPILAIPVSLIGTFIFFIPFGFTINTLTLFAFVLVCFGVLVLPRLSPDVKKKSFQLPYINGQFIIPVLAAIFIYFGLDRISSAFAALATEGYQEFLYLIFVFVLIIVSILSFIRKYSVIPIVGAMCCMYLMIEIPPVSWLWFFVWMTIGLIFYSFYGRRKSLLAKEEGVS